MWRKYFKMPFQNGSDIYIFDADGHPIADFTTELTEGSCDRIVATLNDEYEAKDPHVVTFDGIEKISLEGIEILRMRGWGYLTGTGGCRLSPEKALEVQESMADYICKKLTTSGSESKTEEPAHDKVYYIPSPIIVKVPHCPKCGSIIHEVTDPDARTLMTWRCDVCGYCQ